MSYILRIDSSPRMSGSHSRRIADIIEQRLLEVSPTMSVRRRDLSSVNLAHITNDAIIGFYTPEEALTADLKAATALSDDLIAELNGANKLLISAPMYNFSVPSSLKAWIDQIVRINKTFSFDGSRFSGLVPLRRAYLALSYGANGYVGDGPLAGMNFLEPYLLSLLSFLGIEETQVFRIEGVASGDEIALTQHHEELKVTISCAITSDAEIRT